MLVETCQISAIADEYIEVKPQTTGHCGNCSVKNACGQNLLSTLYPNRSTRIPIENKGFVGELGDRVTIEIEERQALLLAAFFYLIPLSFMLLSIILGARLGFSEFWIIITSLVSLGLGVGSIRLLMKTSKQVSHLVKLTS